MHSAKRACTHACSSRKRCGAGSPVARTLPRPLQNPKKLGCGMVFKPHSRFLEQMLAMLRYPMRSSRKRSVEPSRTTCLGVPGRPGTVSPAPPPCPAPSPRCKMWFQKKNCPKVSAPSPAQPRPSQPLHPAQHPAPDAKCGSKRKTAQKFRSKRFGQNVSPKTLLAPKPLTISINPQL